MIKTCIYDKNTGKLMGLSKRFCSYTKAINRVYFKNEPYNLIDAYYRKLLYEAVGEEGKHLWTLIRKQSPRELSLVDSRFSLE